MIHQQQTIQARHVRIPLLVMTLLLLATTILPTATVTAAGSAEVTVSTLAGSGAPGYQDGVGIAAQFNGPTGGAVDRDGNFYTIDAHNHRIRKITPDGVVSTFAGSGVRGFQDGPGDVAQFYYPQDIVVGSDGALYVTDMNNFRIRKILPDGTTSTFSGSGMNGGRDGPGDRASFNYPRGITVDGAGNLYVSETYVERIRKILPDGTTSTFAGDGTSGYQDGPGATARFSFPVGLATDTAGNLYVSDSGNHRIRKITPEALVSTFAGDGTAGYSDGLPTVAQFNDPRSMTIDTSGNIYIVDTNNFRIRKILPSGITSTFTGDGTYGYQDGPAATAQFSRLFSVVADGNGIIYVSDTYNNRIRKITIPQPDPIEPGVPPVLPITPPTSPNTGTATTSAVAPIVGVGAVVGMLLFGLALRRRPERSTRS